MAITKDPDESVHTAAFEGKTHCSPNLGYFEKISDGEKRAVERVFVLVVHYDFKTSLKGEGIRDGDAEDVANLRRTFEVQRNCNFKDLPSPKKEFLLELLKNEEQLMKFFNADELPSVFNLFVLSHGDGQGRIYTDHWEQNLEEYNHFTTADVFESMSKLHKFSKCLKFVNIGPCRGPINDKVFTNKEIQKITDMRSNKNSVRVTFSPKMHNLVLIYSTIESVGTRTETRGSWFVQEICEVLNTMKEDKPLATFLTLIQFRIHQRSRNSSDICGKNTGQLLEFKMFTQDATFVISALPRNKQEQETFSRSNADGKVPREDIPVKPINDFYSWKSDIRGRRAIIFSENHSQVVNTLNEALSENLSFDTSIRTLTLENLKAFSKCEHEFEHGVGCLLTCIFSKIVEEEESKEICVQVDGAIKPISNIMHNIVGSMDVKWIGKPKLFFIIEPSTESADDLQVHSASNVERIKVTNHSGWLVLILRGKDLVEKFIKIFEGNHLKEGKSIQELISTLLITSECNVNNLMLNSTLEYLLDFPDWPREFVKPYFWGNSGTSCRKKISYDNLLRYAEKTKGSRIWLLSSVAGAGKSTVLKELAYDLRKTLLGVKILQISLPQTCARLAHGAKQSIPTLEEFLATSTFSSSAEVEETLKNRKLIIFFDGFDEIDSHYRNMVLALSEELASKTSIWISTRPHEVKNFRDLLCDVVEIEIVHFNKEQQVSLLQLVTKKSEEDCNAFLERIRDQKILENPLHLSLVSKFADRDNLYDIYRKMVQEKIKQSLMNRKLIELEKTLETYIKTLMEVALRSIIQDNFSSIQLTENEKETLNNSGIANVFGKQVLFQHRTFAEFLTAQKFLSDLEMKGNSDINLLSDDHLGQCRQLVDSFFSTIKEDDVLLKGKSEQLLAFALNKGCSLNMLCEENLENIFTIIKSKISFNQDMGNTIYEGDSVKLFLNALHSEGIAMQLLEMNAIKSEEELAKELPKILYTLACGNSIGLLNKLKEKFPNIQELIQSQSENAGILAAREGNHQVLDFLLSNGLDVNFTGGSFKKFWGLEIVCKYGNVSCLEVLLKHGVDLNTRFTSETSAVHEAAGKGHLPVVKLLVLEKMQRDDEVQVVNLKDQYGRNALNHAVKGGHLEVCRWLIEEAHVDINAAMNGGCTILHEAVETQVENLDVVEYLLSLGMDIGLKDNDGLTALHHACRRGHLNIVKMLLEKGANMLDLDSEGRNAFHYAIRGKGPSDLAKYLYDEDLANDYRGTSLLHYACKSGDIQAVEKMISFGADLRVKDNEGWNAMHHACKNNQLNVAKFLHEKDDELVKQKTNDGLTVFNEALYDGKKFPPNEKFINWLMLEASTMTTTN